MRDALADAEASLARLEATVSLAEAASALEPDGTPDLAGREYYVRKLLEAFRDDERAQAAMTRRTIVWARDHTSLSTYRLGKAAGVSATSVARWQRGDSQRKRGGEASVAREER